MRYKVKPRFWIFLNIFVLLLFSFVLFCMHLYFNHERLILSEKSEERNSLILSRYDWDKMLIDAKNDAFAERLARDRYGYIYPYEVRYLSNKSE